VEEVFSSKGTGVEKQLEQSSSAPPTFTLAPYLKKSLRERYSLYTPTPSGARPFLYLVWDFLRLVRFPAIAYTALMWGASLTWFSVVLTTMSTYFTLPPYNFSPSGVGLMNLPPFIGVALALTVSASNDWIILKLAKRNGGVFEPEMRLWLGLVGVVLTPAGMLLFGLAITEVGLSLESVLPFSRKADQYHRAIIGSCRA